ncbi:MAG TPA: helix-turn-helix domain-containing GNAT family N-acetyltransferase [Gemmatimonadaceae bacterium]|jgi:DNA-binding MarR family transcriptional regulator/N-acetylglutamate synthase-like GNAT family acetyltransferase
MRQIDTAAEQVRDFNRFYTRRIGALGDGHLGSPFSLTEVRVLFELAHRSPVTASEIADALGLDRGYLSRTLRAFKAKGFIETEPAAEDRRQTILRLTAAGRKAFTPLDRAAREEIIRMLQPLDAEPQRRVLAAMRTIRQSLDPVTDAPSDPPFTLRTHRPGDMGWVVQRHGLLYAEEYGWDERFEALVAGIVSEFIKHFDPKRERCWIAERDGESVGSIFIVSKSKTVVKLRLLLVEPSARGLGVGRALVDEVIRFARQTGYRKIQLWTHPELTAARRIYKAVGFELIAEEEHSQFGKPMRAETWEMVL